MEMVTEESEPAVWGSTEGTGWADRGCPLDGVSEGAPTVPGFVEG